MARNSESSFETTGAGVPLGAMNAYHMSTSAPFTPSSCRLGTSGAFGWRFALPTASAFNRPALTWGMATWIGTNPTLTSPESRSVSAPALPL